MIAGLDKECEKLVKVLNEMDGIATIESCCGHLTAPYKIWFVSNSFSAVGILYRSVDRRYSDGKWRIEVDCSDRIPTNGFLLTSVEPFVSDSDMEESVDALINNIQYWSGCDYKEYFKELESIDEYKVEVDIEMPTIQLTRLEMLKWCWENIRDSQSAKRQNEIVNAIGFNYLNEICNMGFLSTYYNKIHLSVLGREYCQEMFK